MTDPLVLKIAVDQKRHPHVKALLNGTITSPRLHLEFINYDPLPNAFRSMVRENVLDVSELAVVTHLLALEFGKDFTALPIPLWRRLHHGNLVCLTDSEIRLPKDLNGKRVGVRAYAQTTGVWIRGVLQTEYGVDLDSITWVTMEDAHIAEFQDPANCVRNSTGKGLRELLYSHDLAAIMGERIVDPANVRPIIQDADKVAEKWASRTGQFPINHVLTVRRELLAKHDWLADELMRLFEASRAASNPTGIMALPHGLETVKSPIDALCGFAFDQKVTKKRWQVDEIFWRSS